VQVIDVNKEATKKRPTLLVKSSFLAFLGILRTCVDFRVSTDFSRFNPDYALGIVARRKRAKKTRAFEGLFGDAIVTLW